MRSSARSIESAIILAAGRGLRMGSLTREIPKPLLPVRGKPILLRTVDSLANAGIREITVVSGYLADQVEKAIYAHPSNCELTVVRQPVLNGTATALLSVGRRALSVNSLVVFADVLVGHATYRSITAAFSASQCALLLGVNRCSDLRLGASVSFDALGQVTGIVEKPALARALPGWNNAGVLAATPILGQYAGNVLMSSRGEYELTSALSAMLEDGHEIKCHVIEDLVHFGSENEINAYNSEREGEST